MRIVGDWLSFQLDFFVNDVEAVGVAILNSQCCLPVAFVVHVGR